MLRSRCGQSRQYHVFGIVRAECLLVLLQPAIVDPDADAHALLPAANLRRFIISMIISTGEPRDCRDRPAQIVLSDPIPEMGEAAPMKRAQMRLANFLPGRAMSPSTV
jgi:hypothetical protein